MSSFPTNDLFNKFESIESEFGVRLHDFKKSYVTGGGSIKFSEKLTSFLGNFSTSDEISSVVRGMFFGLHTLKNIPDSSIKYPIILANVGTGASFIFIEKNRSFKRIGGTNLAGGTLSGIFALLKEEKAFVSSFSSSVSSGDRNNVDILVKDIYGSSYESIGLDGNIVAGSLAKLNQYSGSDINADVCASSAYMICSNLIHLLCLYATLHGAFTIIFGGSFSTIPAISEMLVTISRDRFPKGIDYKVLDFGGYLGCLGIVSQILDES